MNQNTHILTITDTNEGLEKNYKHLLGEWKIKQYTHSGINVFQSVYNVPRKYEKYLILSFDRKKNMICSILLKLHNNYPSQFALNRYLSHTQLIFDLITQFQAKYYSMGFIYNLLYIYIQDNLKFQQVETVKNIFWAAKKEWAIVTSNIIDDRPIIQKILSKNKHNKKFITNNNLSIIQKDWLKIKDVYTKNQDFYIFFPDTFINIFKQKEIDEISFSYLKQKVFPLSKQYIEKAAEHYVFNNTQKKYIQDQLDIWLSLRKILFLSNLILQIAKK